MLQLELEQTYWWDAAIEMGDQISWFVELAVKPGQLDNFQALTSEMVEVLTYQRFVSTGQRGYGLRLARVWLAAS